MKNFGNKIDNDETSAGVVVANEYNSIFNEAKGAVTPFLELNESDNQQLGKVIDIASKATFYNDVGSPNAVHLTRGATAEQIETLFDGMVVMFSPANANTGASTLKVNGLGAKVMKFNDSALVAGMLIVGAKYMAIYSASTDDFSLDVLSLGTSPLNIVDKGYVDGLVQSKGDKHQNSVPIMQNVAGSQITPFHGWAKPFGSYQLEFTTTSGTPWASKPSAEREMMIAMGKENVQDIAQNFHVYRVTLPSGREGLYVGAYSQIRFFKDRKITVAAFTKMLSGNAPHSYWAEGMTNEWKLTGMHYQGNSLYTFTHPFGNQSGSACVFLVALPAAVCGHVDLTDPQAWWQFPNFNGGWG